MATKKKKKSKRALPRDAKPAERRVTDPDARGHTGQYGKGSFGSRPRAGVVKINKGAGRKRGG